MNALSMLPVCSMDSPNALFLAFKRLKTDARIATHERLRDHNSMARDLIGLHWLPADKGI